MLKLIQYRINMEKKAVLTLTSQCIWTRMGNRMKFSLENVLSWKKWRSKTITKPTKGKVWINQKSNMTASNRRLHRAPYKKLRRRKPMDSLHVMSRWPCWWNFIKRISVSFVCNFVFLQHGRPNHCFLNLEGLIANQVSHRRWMGFCLIPQIARNI